MHDTGLVGSLICEADRQKYPADHPLRRIAARMDAAIRAYYALPCDKTAIEMRRIYAATKLAHQQYWENRAEDIEAGLTHKERQIRARRAREQAVQTGD